MTKHIAQRATAFRWSALLLATLGACNRTDPAAAESTASNAAAQVDPAAAKELFAQRCGACHGNDGHGDGPGAVALTPKPRNFHDPAWQKSVTDEQIRKTFTLGGAAVGKSPQMPSAPDLEQNPEAVAKLLFVVRSFGK